jgi:threonyl-tRNA synthetase
VQAGQDILDLFGFTEVKLFLSTRPESFMGEIAAWDRAEASLRRVLEATGRPFEVDEGGGAFYGPKIDLKIRDALGREWQCGTFQLDFQLPQRFELEYVAADGTRQRPVMIHRALLGSVERFIAILIEHFAGAFPLWLAPVQCEIVPVQDDAPEVIEYVIGLRDTMRAAGLRAEVNDKPGERMQARIREAELRKVPYIVVVGRRDIERGDGVVNVRSTRGGTQENVAAADLVARLLAEAASRAPG